MDTKDLKRNESELNNAFAGIAGQKHEKPDFDPRNTFNGQGVLKVKKVKRMGGL